MSDILNKIIATKKSEIAQLKQTIKVSELEASAFFNRRGKSLKKALLETKSPGIITEFKRRSPSAGIINAQVAVQNIVRGYVKAGAIGVSVLTDKDYFGGSIEDLKQARQVTETPLLRKDFIIDEFQLYEAKANGADVILLIAEALTKEELYALAQKANELNLEVLCEIHSEEQLEKLNKFVDIVGVNNRNLSNFEVSTANSVDLFNKIPNQYAKISESGINEPNEVKDLFKVGYKGFLIGGHFMQQEDPSIEAERFIEEIKV